MKNQNPTDLFTKTVEDYAKYRPAYPKEILELLIVECGLTQDKIIADVASGTGLLSKLFLDYGNVVYGVEPNEAMRTAAENYLKDYSRFHNINGTAESTSLKKHSVDIITVGTAFHWFDVTKTKKEFSRILKKGGWVLLAWNVRDIEHSPLINDYENLIIEFCKNYKDTESRFNNPSLNEFFSPYEMKTQTFKNIQHFDWHGLKGRLLSSSFSLREDDAGYEEMLEELKKIFDRYQKNNKVDFLYKTKVYYSRILR